MTNVIDKHRNEVAALCQRAGARRLDAFGSVLRDDFDPQTSDLDFLVEFDIRPGFDYFSAYFGLKEGLERVLKRPVEVVSVSSIRNPYFREQVMRTREQVHAA